VGSAIVQLFQLPLAAVVVAACVGASSQLTNDWSAAFDDTALEDEVTKVVVGMLKDVEDGPVDSEVGTGKQERNTAGWQLGSDWRTVLNRLKEFFRNRAGQSSAEAEQSVNHAIPALRTGASKVTVDIGSAFRRVRLDILSSGSWLVSFI
jgi:hypothetical protein